MKKYLLIAALLSTFCLQSFCQNFGHAKIDSIRYDSTKKMLPFTKGKERVDLLNSISEMTEMIGTNWDKKLTKQKYDSITYYASQAYELADKMGYNDGIAMALINMSQHGTV